MINIALRRAVSAAQRGAAVGRFHCVVSSHSQKNVSSIFATQQRSILPRSFATDSPGRKKFEDYIESLSPARKKFHYILEEYKKNNFNQAMPSRFFKMMIKAVDSNDDGVITMDEYQTLLKNIGASDQMSAEELKEIFDEIGDSELNGERVISVKSVEERWTKYLHVM